MVSPSSLLDSFEDEQAIVSTGNRDVDEKLGGGIPEKSLILIEGPSASGKSVLTQQLTWGSLYDNHKVILYTTERTVSSHISQMANRAWAYWTFSY